MSAPNLPSSQMVNDSSFFAVLMPNQGRTRFLRGVILLFLVVGALAWIVIAVRTFSEFHARHSWPVAQGHVTAVKVKSYTGPSSRDHVSHYFVEYEVRFAVPAEQCLTGTTFVIDREPPLCEGIAHTRTTDSEALANTWGERHRFNPAVGVLHDPNGPGVKIVGEQVTLVYPWREIIGMSGWMISFLTFLVITQRRLQFLKTLPEDYEASPPPSSQPPGPNDLTDLKLS
jgi:hypothetical protein